MKQDEYSTARPTPKRWSNRNTSFEPRGWARPKTDHRAPTNLIESVLVGAFIESECAVKEGRKVVNHDWVNRQACTPSHKIYVVAASFISKMYPVQADYKLHGHTLAKSAKCHHNRWFRHTIYTWPGKHPEAGAKHPEAGDGTVTGRKICEEPA